MEGGQYGGGLLYGGGIASVRGRIFSTDVSHHQCEGGISSVQWRVCSMSMLHNQYGGGCATHDYQNCSGGSWWLYFSGKNDILQKILPRCYGDPFSMLI